MLDNVIIVLKTVLFSTFYNFVQRVLRANLPVNSTSRHRQHPKMAMPYDGAIMTLLEFVANIAVGLL